MANNLSDLAYDELCLLQSQGKIEIRAKMSLAMHICDRDPRIPGSWRFFHHFSKWIGLLLLVGGPISIFFVGWCFGLLLFFASFPVLAAVRKTAGHLVSLAVLANESLYYDCLRAGALLITEKHV